MRQGDPCSRGAVFCRTTLDVISDEVITKHYPDRVGCGFKWRTEIPGGPRDILVRYFHDATGGWTSPWLSSWTAAEVRGGSPAGRIAVRQGCLEEGRVGRRHGGMRLYVWRTERDDLILRGGGEFSL